MSKKIIPDWAWDVDLHLSMLALALLAVITLLGVMMRYLANAPLVWLDEMQMLCMLWGACLGASAAFRHGGHIGIDMLVGLFPPGMRRAVGAAVFLAVLFLLAFLAWNCYGLVRQQFVNNRFSDVMRLPRGYVYLAMPLAAAGMIVGHCRNALRRLRPPPAEAPASGEKEA